uniref:Uncharacterized protein n=1 Tax=Romanomermis culicivorax TaxID=13658 RepID=A0A915JEB9_ROMCU
MAKFYARSAYDVLSIDDRKPHQESSTHLKTMKVSTGRLFGSPCIYNGNLAYYNQSVFPSFPSTAESDARKMNKKEKRRLGRLYRVKFSNDIAMLRYHANRWIRGGRLSTTGKFIEATEDDNDEGNNTLNFACAEGAEKSVDYTSSDVSALKNGISVENLEIFEQLCQECLPISIPPKRKVDVHVIYEDTHRYYEYNRYWNELHGYSAPSDDVEQAWQRKWYQYYNYAINFIDIPDDFDDDSEYQGNVLPEKMELYYQQWRWKQVQRLNGNSNVNYTKIDQRSKVCFDGVSFAGEPVVYEKSFKQSQ